MFKTYRNNKKNITLERIFGKTNISYIKLKRRYKLSNEVRIMGRYQTEPEWASDARMPVMTHDASQEWGPPKARHSRCAPQSPLEVIVTATETRVLKWLSCVVGDQTSEAPRTSIVSDAHKSASYLELTPCFPVMLLLYQ